MRQYDDMFSCVNRYSELNSNEMNADRYRLVLLNLWFVLELQGQAIWARFIIARGKISHFLFIKLRSMNAFKKYNKSVT